MSQFAKSMQKTEWVSKIPMGKTVQMQYEGVTEQVGEPDEHSNPDGSFGRWEFLGADGSQYAHTHKSSANAVHIAMQKAGIEKGDWMEITPVMEGQSKRFTVIKVVKQDADQPF